MNREIKAAAEYILNQMQNQDIPPEALRQLIEDRIRMACAEAIRWQGNHLNGIANKLACGDAL